jgi:hypothetical protein
MSWAVARLVAGLLVPAGEPVTVAIDGALFRRRDKKVRAASRFHNGSAPGPAKPGYGNNWVITAVVVRLSAGRRPDAIPVLAKLVIKNTSSVSRLWLCPPDDADARRGDTWPRHPRRRRFRLRRRRGSRGVGDHGSHHSRGSAEGNRPLPDLPAAPTSISTAAR